jgi:hypothetical protein
VRLGLAEVTATLDVRPFAECVGREARTARLKTLMGGQRAGPARHRLVGGPGERLPAPPDVVALAAMDQVLALAAPT